MNADWFIRSRGPFVEHEYVWYSLSGADSARAQQVIDAGYRGTNCLTFVNPERPGLLLFSAGRELLSLVVTGLIPKGDPEDFRRRPIRVTLLGVADVSDQAARTGLLAVAAVALRDELALNIPVKYDRRPGGEGFEADAKAWSAFADRSVSSRVPPPGPGEPGRGEEPGRAMLAPDTAESRCEVADELDALAGQPAWPPGLEGRIVVLRTNLADRAGVGRVRPWRTLSDIVDAPEDVSVQPPPADGLGALGNSVVRVSRWVIDVITEHRGPSAIVGVVLAGALIWSPARPGPPAPEVLRWGVRPVVSAGEDFSLLLTSAGKVLAWGADNAGQLDAAACLEPGPVVANFPQSTGISSVSAGCEHSLALTSSGAVLAWGDNDDGQLGRPCPRFSAAPVQVTLPGPAEAISAGCHDSLARTRKGERRRAKAGRTRGPAA